MAEFLYDWENLKILAIATMGICSAFMVLRNKGSVPKEQYNSEDDNENISQIDNLMEEEFQEKLSPEDTINQQIAKLLMEKLKKLKPISHYRNTSTNSQHQDYQSKEHYNNTSEEIDGNQIKIEDSIISINLPTKSRQNMFFPQIQSKQMQIQSTSFNLDASTIVEKRLLSNYQFLQQVGRIDEMNQQYQYRQQQAENRKVLFKLLTQRRNKLQKLRLLRIKSKKIREQNEKKDQKRKRQVKKRKNKQQIVYIINPSGGSDSDSEKDVIDHQQSPLIHNKKKVDFSNLKKSDKTIKQIKKIRKIDKKLRKRCL